MSPTMNDRKLRSNFGKTFPPEPEHDRPPFADAIATALKVEFGRSPAAIKTIGRLTRTNQRAVRNWFEGRNGPSGEHLVTLIRHSDEVLQTVLQLAGRRELAVTRELSRLKEQMQVLIKTINDI